MANTGVRPPDAPAPPRTPEQSSGAKRKGAPRNADGSIDLLNGARADLYVAHSLEMRASPAWRGLPDDARRVLDRLEIEHLRKRLCGNGNLICPYDDFVEHGVRRAAVRLAIEQSRALGFLEIVRRGYAARTDVRVPSIYRLTYVKSYKDTPPATDDWKALNSAEAVRVALKNALAELENERARRRARRNAAGFGRAEMRKTSLTGA
jgi:hypothetical protein